MASRAGRTNRAAAASSRRAELEALRRSRQAGVSRLDTYEIKDEAPIFEELDENEYKSRLEDDFVVDDDNRGYVDDGMDDESDGGYSDVSEDDIDTKGSWSGNGTR
ncbi:hypothetical protein HK405_012829 [Cladochytrium tenue]|nr:hypothetical protein HK405_012829 [Cladochytrium tenue]